MSISKITPAAVNNSLEIAPALANISFDFSLWKVEPPKEFDGVGSALSSVRRDKAENGMPHVTARKLGALFEAIIPSTPKLCAAYGQRASEISQVSSLGPEARKQYGAFAGYVGSDATSIWAAATSGPASIAIHLLACLLARVWNGPEAISIWVEIVRKRKEIIKSEFYKNNIQELTAMEAAKQDITRAQLAEWDASARSWLLTADTVKSRQQKQLKLIIDNVKGCVNGIPETYRSVIAAWKNSLIQMEGLIDGISQQAANGDILLAISAWHLFPDMMIVRPSSTHVSQNDVLFASGGVLTIGLETRDSNNGGISWSLPLACLRFYGAPVKSSCSLNSDEQSRLTIDELLQAILGCFFVGWQLRDCDTTDAITWLSQISDILQAAALSGSKEARGMISGVAESSWFNLILLAAKNHLQSTDTKRNLNRKLVMLGRRHGKSFLGLPLLPLFGLTNRGNFLFLIKDENERIEFLRLVAKDFQKQNTLGSHEMFIRYRHQCRGTSKTVFEYATAVRRENILRKRSWDNRELDNHSHIRWLYSGSKDLSRYPVRDSIYLRAVEGSGFYGAKVENYDELNSNLNSWYRASRDYFDPSEMTLVHQEFKSRSENCTELVKRTDDEVILDELPDRAGVYWKHYGLHNFAYGDINSAALFTVADRGTLTDLIRPHHVASKEFFSLFNSDSMDHDAVIRYFDAYFRTGNPQVDPHIRSVKAISTAAKLYKSLEHATVDVRVLQQNLCNSLWVTNADWSTTFVPATLLPYDLSREGAFACITMFETGRYNPNPLELKDVMAMSFGDSIFAAVALVSDLSPASFSGEIRRLKGNVGQPGLVYMVPPKDPLLKEVTISEWPKISRNNFDGKPRDCFPGTSIHLSFTGARTNLNLGFSGAQDDEVYILETLISVHDNGKWVADLNPMRTFELPPRLQFLKCENESEHSTLPRPDLEMTSIENWFELIDAPESYYSVVQTRGNWQAKFAAAAINTALNYRTIVVPNQPCWKCFTESCGQNSYDLLRSKWIVVLA